MSATATESNVDKVYRLVEFHEFEETTQQLPSAAVGDDSGDKKLAVAAMRTVVDSKNEADRQHSPSSTPSRSPSPLTPLLSPEPTNHFAEEKEKVMAQDQTWKLKVANF